MRDIAIILAICASLGVLVGLIFTSSATMGVAIIAVCCFLAILARLAQAGHHHREIMRALDARDRRPAEDRY